MARILTVRERAFRSIEATLRGITQLNGYNTDVHHVWRLRSIMERVDDPPVIQMLIGESIITEKGNTQNMVNVSVEFWTSQQLCDDPDTEFNLLAGDIERALRQPNAGGPNGGVFDEFNINQSYEVVCRPMNVRPFYADVRDSQIVGRITYDVLYWYLDGDPRRWDSSDQLVELVE